MNNDRCFGALEFILMIQSDDPVSVSVLAACWRLASLAKKDVATQELFHQCTISSRASHLQKFTRRSIDVDEADTKNEAHI